MMSMISDILREHIDAIILSTLMRKDSYGYEINTKIKKCSGGVYELNEATLYTTFKRLEDGGYIHSYWGTEPSHARRKYYHITPYGSEKHRCLLEEWQASKRIMDILLCEEEGDEHV